MIEYLKKYFRKSISARIRKFQEKSLSFEAPNN